MGHIDDKLRENFGFPDGLRWVHCAVAAGVTTGLRGSSPFSTIPTPDAEKCYCSGAASLLLPKSGHQWGDSAVLALPEFELPHVAITCGLQSCPETSPPRHRFEGGFTSFKLGNFENNLNFETLKL